MSVRWKEEQFKEYMTKRNALRDDPLEEKPDPGMESELQTKCLRYCKEHGFPVFHDYSRKKNPAGWADLFIFAENRVVLVELKSASGKLRKEQQELRRVLAWLGHKVHVVRSYVGFVRVMME